MVKVWRHEIPQRKRSDKQIKKQDKNEATQYEVCFYTQFQDYTGCRVWKRNITDLADLNTERKKLNM